MEGKWSPALFRYQKLWKNKSQIGHAIDALNGSDQRLTRFVPQ